MLTSDTITKITPALIKAQAEFKPAVKDAVNPAFARGQNPKPSYVTLAQAIDSVSDALRANGIALIQQTDIQDARMVLVTRLIHESGEWIAGRYPGASGEGRSAGRRLRAHVCAPLCAYGAGRDRSRG
jgi:hypothetical protein